MPITNDGYSPRSKEDIKESLRTAFKSIHGFEVDETTVLEKELDVYAEVLAENQEDSLSELYDAAYIETAEGRALDRRVQDFSLSRRPAIPSTGVIEFNRSTPSPTDFTIPSGTIVQTDTDKPISFVTTETAVLSEGTSSVQANIKATEGGSHTNVGANTISVMPSPPDGVESITNPIPTGDTSETNTDGGTLIKGLDRETDEELRERASESKSFGGSGTVNAIKTQLMNIDERPSVSIYTNRTNTDDFHGNGLPKRSAEIIIESVASKEKLANVLHDTVPFTTNLVGGINGTKQTKTITDDVLLQDREYVWSNPTEVNIDFTIDIVHDDTYVGSERLKNEVVDIIGGLDTDGEPVNGTDVGQNIYVDAIENAIHGEENGVLAVTNIVADTDGDGSDNTSTDSNGARVISVDKSSVAKTNATDGSITINETQA